MKRVISFLMFLTGCFVLIAQNGETLFDNSYVHEIRIEFSEPEFWDTLTYYYEEFSQFSGSDIPYMEAAIEIDGESLSAVGVRLKAKSSYYYVDEKKPFKIDFNQFIDSLTFDGLKKINLQNGIGDPSMQRDLLCYDLMRSAGVKAPRVSYCRLYLNDEFWGVYEIIEQIDKTFLKNNFADPDGNLYKNQRWSNLEWFGSDPALYQDTFELKTNTDENDWSDFIHFLDVLNNTTDSAFANSIRQVFNVDQFLHVMAIDVMTNNWDSYIDNSRNWYMYHEPASGLFHWIPWDYNLAMGGKLSTSGNPFPPYDPDCIIQNTFSHVKDSLTVTFTEYTEPVSEDWLWDFGDGTTSTNQHPQHAYSESGIYTVCLTSFRQQNNDICEQTRCIEVDLSFDPADCESIQNGSSPYQASDPIYQQVIEEDNYCCSDEWDVFCTIAYLDIQNNGQQFEIDSGVDYSLDFPLIIDNPEKILINRLLAVPEFRDRYLDICCIIENKLFDSQLLYPKIDYYADLLRDAIYDDPNYIYTRDYFEYDVGNGTGGGSEARIPALKYFFGQRIPQIQEDIQLSGHDCSAAYSAIDWHVVVVNEFMASSDEESGLFDPAGEAEDWIELYNNGNDTVFLAGFYLTDDPAVPLKWAFPEASFIEPQGYLIVWADNDIDQEGLHANFKLSKNGESILLRHEDGTWIDFVTFEAQETNISSARIPNGFGAFVSQPPTFNENNELIDKVENLDFPFHVRIYPNPANSWISVLIDSEIIENEIEITLFNLIGQQVFNRQFQNSNNLNIDLSQSVLSAGIYLVELKFNGLTLTQKLSFKP